MPKLSISCADWLEAATYGKIELLEQWHRSGALDIRYDPVRVGVSGGQGRAKIFDVCDADKRNALYVAISSGQSEYALRLMSLGKFAATRTRDGRTPLHAAALMGSSLLPSFALRIIPELAQQGHPLDVADNKGMTPLLLAINSHKDANVRALLKAGASPNETPASEPPLARAVQRASGAGSVEIVSMLLQAGADPNARSGKFDSSPLHILAALWSRDDDKDEASANRQIMRLLIDAGADPDATIEENGNLMSVEQSFYTPVGAQVMRKLVVEKQAADLSLHTAHAQGAARSARL